MVSVSKEKYFAFSSFFNHLLKSFSVKTVSYLLSTLAGLLAEAGYKVVAVSDSKGGIYAPQGLDIASVTEHKNQSREMKAVYCQGTVCSIVSSSDQRAQRSWNPGLIIILRRNLT